MSLYCGVAFFATPLQFRLHKSAKPEQTSQFFVEWEKYLTHVERTGRGNQTMDAGLGDDSRAPPKGITSYPASKNGMSDQQKSPSFGKELGTVDMNEEQEKQLEKLREEAAKAGAIQ
jgi:hypothetical protein